MSRRKLNLVVALLLIPGLLVVGGCPPDDPSLLGTGFRIAAKVFVLALQTAGVINARAASATPARSGGIVSLQFDDAPVDQPGSAEMRIGTVRALPLDESAKSASFQALSGSATVVVYVSSADSSNPCEVGVRIGSFGLTFAGGEVTVRNGSLQVPAAALPFLIAGEFGVCFEATVTIDVQIVIEEVTCTFGEDVGEGPVTAPSEPDEVEPAGGGDGGVGADDGGDGDGGTDGGDGGADGGDGGGMFNLAFIRHRGTEQLIAGPAVDDSISFAFDDDYSAAELIFDLRNRAYALNGSGTRVWLRLFAPFAVKGKPRTQLWSMNTDGTGAVESPLPAHDLNSGLHLATDQDGLYCFANNIRIAKMYQAPAGGAAGEILDYAGALDFDMNFRVNADSSRMYLANIGRFGGAPSIHTVNLVSAPLDPSVVLTQDMLAIQGVRPRNMALTFDLAAFSSSYVFRPNYNSSTLTPNTQDVFFLGRGFSAPTSEIILQTDYTQSPYDLNITDDGGTITYLLPTPDGSINGPNTGVVENLSDGSQWTFSDGRSAIGYLVLSDGGNRAYYRTDKCCSGGSGILHDVGTDRRYPAGTQVFGGTAWGNVQLSDDGDTLVRRRDRTCTACGTTSARRRTCRTSSRSRTATTTTAR